MTFVQPKLKEIIEVAKHYDEHSITRNILSNIQKNKSKYAHLYPRLYSLSSASKSHFLEEVLTGAMLLDIIHPSHQDNNEHHELLGKVCTLFGIEALSELPESESSKWLTCLGHFITVIDKKDPTLLWSDSQTNEEILTTLSNLLFHKENPSEEVAVDNIAENSNPLHLDEYLKHALNAAEIVEANHKAAQSGLFRWFSSANPIDLERVKSAQFIQKIATSIQTSIEKEGLPHQNVLFLQNTLIGGMSFALIHLTQLFPNKYESTANCPLAKGLFDCLAIEKLADISEGQLSIYLNALADYIQQHPSTQWHQALDNSELLEKIQPRPWDIVGAATVQSLSISQ